MSSTPRLAPSSSSSFSFSSSPTESPPAAPRSGSSSRFATSCRCSRCWPSRWRRASRARGSPSWIAPAGPGEPSRPRSRSRWCSGSSGYSVASGAVHLTFDRWGASQRQIRDAIRDETGTDSILVTNWWATKKFTGELDRDCLPIDRDEVTPEQVALPVREHGAVWLALLDRSDSEYWRTDAWNNKRFLTALSPQRPELMLDQVVTPTDRLRIWRIAPGG